MARAPIAGTTLTLTRAGAPLPASCFDDAAQQNQITLANGNYRFDINFADPACPSGANYIIDVTAPGSAYVAGYSQIIPPTSDGTTAPFSVPSCQTNGTDAVPGTTRCEVQTSGSAPLSSVQARSSGTNYHVHLTLDGSAMPDTSQIFNNHIPLDPVLTGALNLSKTTPLLHVTRGQLVPYTITFTSTFAVPLADIVIVDRFPAGFHYVEKSASIDGVATEPALAGLELTWSGLSVAASGRHTIVMLLAVGAGVGEGEFVNRAQAIHRLTGAALSGEATARVRVMPDPTFDCTDVIGKVYDDANRNGIQEDGELGLPGVRVATTRGLAATTDAHGRYHITCAVTPHEGRGSNFVLKLDDRTLPTGYRPSTQQVRVERATRGKTMRFNFAASIHRVIGLDVADAVFEPGTTQMRMQWRPRTQLLVGELQKAPAVLHVSYLADLEDEELVERRLAVIKEEIMNAWKASNGAYPLTIEPEVFWRLGAPPKKSTMRVRAGR